MRQSLLL
jgi:Uncharacterized BCR, YitT family COG1284.